MKSLFEITGCEAGVVRDMDNNLMLMKWGRRNGIPQIRTYDEFDPRLAGVDENLISEMTELDIAACQMINDHSPYEIFKTFMIYNDFGDKVWVTVVKGKNE